LRGTAFPQPFQSRVVAVGHDKHSFSLVRRAAFSRAKYSPRRFVTKAFQVCNDLSESKANVSFHVLKETELWSKKSNAACDVGPKMSWVVCSFSESGCTKWLTRVATSKNVHAVTKLCPWEGLKIRPYRCWVHESRFHFSDQVRNGEGFDLTKSDAAQIWDCSFKSNFDAAISGTKAEMSCLGSIHIMFLS
jgi:hypothetical protein